MIPPEGQPILTAAAMRTAEERAVETGTSLATLMQRAGEGVAEAARRLSAGADVLVLCGPGNNGGDGWIAAATLADAGHPVRVAAIVEPATDLARSARARWTGPVETFADVDPAPVCVDALFGTGLKRPLDGAVEERLTALLQPARLGIAVDLPSGLPSDAGDAPHGWPVQADLTLALGALKPAHLLYPAADHCGTIRLLDIGLGLDAASSRQGGSDRAIEQPWWVKSPGSSSHKYSRGFVAVIGGAMPGAAALAAEAAMYAGAGYALLLADQQAPGPHALVRRDWSPEALRQALDGKNPAQSALVVGPGLGRNGEAEGKLDAALGVAVPLVIDGDALHLLDGRRLNILRGRAKACSVVLTPHAGEFRALFGDWSGASKIEAARDAAARSGATVVFKGPDTVVAYPDGRTRTMPHASFWLSAAGTGDVLAGAIGAMLAASTPAPAETAVWMHVQAARRLGGPFLADDLARGLAAVRAAL